MEQPEEITVAIRIDTEQMAVLMPHAESAVRDGLLTFDEAVALMCQECCFIAEETQ